MHFVNLYSDLAFSQFYPHNLIFMNIPISNFQKTKYKKSFPVFNKGKNMFLLFINESNHGKPVSRCRWARCTSVLRLQNPVHIGRHKLSGSHLNQCSRYDPNHIIKKTIPRYPNGNDILLLCHCAGVNRANTGPGLRVRSTKALKIMFPHQMVRGLLHLPHIQRIIIKIGIQTSGRHPELPVQDSIFIGFPAFGKTRVKAFRHLTGILHNNILRQALV